MRRLCVDLDGTFKHFIFSEKDDYNNRIVGYFITMSYVKGCDTRLRDYNCGVYIIIQRFGIGPHGIIMMPSLFG